MSGISRSFKFPTVSLAKKRKISHGLPQFNWENVDDLRELGVGNFGSVHSAKYVHGTEDKKVVIKKLRGESNEAKRRFLKEAEMLHSIKHQNIPSLYKGRARRICMTS